MLAALASKPLNEKERRDWRCVERAVLSLLLTAHSCARRTSSSPPAPPPRSSPLRRRLPRSSPSPSKDPTMLRYFLAGERAPPIKLNRRPSNQPLLPSPLGGKPQPTQARSRKVTAVQVLTVVVLLYWVVTLGGWVVGTTGQKKAAVLQLRRDSCEARGLVTATKDEQHRAVIRLRPAPPNELRTRNPDNTILPFSLHPSLSDALPRLFDGTSSPNAFPVGKTCVTPHIQQLPLHPRLESSPHEPEIFFSISTTPSRAVTSASIWSTFMSAPIPSTNDLATNNGRTRRPHAPGCLVTDAQNKGDSQGAAKAHAEFQRQGISCVFRDSTRASERYEMRVLSLVRDAWLESERRRWRDGSPIVEWFVFQDDDTCTLLLLLPLSSRLTVSLSFQGGPTETCSFNFFRPCLAMKIISSAATARRRETSRCAASFLLSVLLPLLTLLSPLRSSPLFPLPSFPLHSSSILRASVASLTEERESSSAATLSAKCKVHSTSALPGSALLPSAATACYQTARRTRKVSPLTMLSKRLHRCARVRRIFLIYPSLFVAILIFLLLFSGYEGRCLRLPHSRNRSFPHPSVRFPSSPSPLLLFTNWIPLCAVTGPAGSTSFLPVPASTPSLSSPRSPPPSVVPISSVDSFSTMARSSSPSVTPSPFSARSSRRKLWVRSSGPGRTTSPGGRQGQGSRRERRN